jgi:hypothetical protein
MSSITLEKLRKQNVERMFGTELLYYVYHKMNNRLEEAETYLQAYYDEQERLKREYDEGEKEYKISNPTFEPIQSSTTLSMEPVEESKADFFEIDEKVEMANDLLYSA